MAQQQRTEERLIERARCGDSRAQQNLWRAHRRWVAAIVLAHRPRSVDVDDLMQEVAVKFISRVQTLRNPRAFRPWLRQIVINVCRGAARSERPALYLADDGRPDGAGPEIGRVAAPPARGSSPAQSADQRDSARYVLDQALTLPPEYREPLLLRCVQALTYQQIGAILDMPVTTVETRLARARRMLREEVGERIAAEGYEEDGR